MQLPAINKSTSPPLQAPAKTLSASSNPNNPVTATTPIETADAKQTANRNAQAEGQNANKQELTNTDYRILAELKKTDREVHAHEQAHLAAAGGLARGGANFGYTKGPDGQRYAVSGEVSIDTSPGANPEATLLKAQRIQAAALAPAQPSSADRAIASGASQMAASARAELLAKRLNPEQTGDSSTDSNRTKTGSTEKKAAAENQTEGSKLSVTISNHAKDLALLIKQTTSTGDALGNLFNTAA